MKQGIPSRRTRGRGNNRGRQQQNVRNQQMDSNGPAGRLRGTPQQILDRYSALARDASSSGDMVLAENLWQHAEHFVRLLGASQPQQQPQQHNQQSGNARDDGYDERDQGEPQTFDPHAPLEPRGEAKGPAALPIGAAAQANVEPAEASQPALTGDDEDGPEQPSSSAVWTPADTEAATEEAQAEQRPSPPRRRRRSRFPRPQENGEANASADASPQPDGERPALKLPEDRSPAALVELITNADNNSRRSEAGDD